MLAGIIGWLTGFWGKVQSIVTYLLDSFLDLLLFVPYTIFDITLSSVEAFLSGISGIGDALSAAVAWSGVPPQAIYLVHQCGIATGLGIIASAISIRVALNFIPAALTRV